VLDDWQRLETLVGATVLDIRPVTGGCITGGSRIRTRRGLHFLKSGVGKVAAWLEAEADGLAFLAEVADGRVVVPGVVGFLPETGGEPALLVTDWIEEIPWSVTHWEALGRGLAAMHRESGLLYGHARDNYIGKLAQRNERSEDWVTFYRACRLEPQAAMARSGAGWRRAWDVPFDALCRTLDERLPTRPPASRLHGDLWSGNVMATGSGQGAVVDPAVHVGDRETDLAMARLFGGFSDRFFSAYGEAWPLDGGWEDREPVYRLYHLLSHLNHFGGAYADAVERTLLWLTRG